MTITMYPYAVRDMPRLLDFRRFCTTPANIDDYPRLTDLHEILSRVSATSQERVALWENASGAIVAYGFVALNYCNLYFLIAPQAQTDELASQIIAWGREQIKATGKCAAIDSPCRDTNKERIELLEQHGFVRSDGETLFLARSLAEPIPQTHFPAGFQLRPVRGEDEVDELVALHQDAFGTQNMTCEGRLSVMRNPEYIPELDLLLLAPDGTYAAFCYCSIPKEANAQRGRNEGEIAIIGTRPAYRKQGLGRAMLLSGLQRLKDHGIETATLGTSSENGGAQSVYTSAGFQIAYRSLWYSRKI